MSGTLINSRQEEIIHKLQKKSECKTNNFLRRCDYGRWRKKIPTTKLREREEKKVS